MFQDEVTSSGGKAKQDFGFTAIDDGRLFPAIDPIAMSRGSVTEAATRGKLNGLVNFGDFIYYTLHGRKLSILIKPRTIPNQGTSLGSKSAVYARVE